MIGTHAGFLAEHWLLALVAGATGVLLAHAYLAAEYLLLPVWRLRAARRQGPAAVARLLDHERRRLSSLGNAAAVYEEHGHPDAVALRDEAELRALMLEVMDHAHSGR